MNGTTQPAASRITPEQMQSIKNPRWLNLIRRLEQLAMSQSGHAILRLSVVVDSAGKPLVWLTPKMDLIEPKDASQDFLDILTKL
jgi:hypothetical protein